MVGEGRVLMSMKSSDGCMSSASDGEEADPAASGTLLGLTNRQVRRLITRVRQEGDREARASRTWPALERRIDARLKAMVLGVYAHSMGILGRPWQRRSWRSGKGLRLVMRPCVTISISEKEIVHAKAHVVKRLPVQHKNDEFHIGASFAEITERDRKALIHYILRLQAERLKTHYSA
jgi:hypothetical protein